MEFYDIYYDAIINGVKTQTMRMPQSRIDVVPGDFVIAKFQSKPNLLLRITDVGYKSFKSINSDDAEREGFSSVQELKKELTRIYGKYNIEGSRFYFYRFEYCEVR